MRGFTSDVSKFLSEKRYKTWFLCLLCVFSFAFSTAASATDSKGTEFWLTFPANGGTGDVRMSLFIAGETATSVTVSISDPAFIQTFDVTPGLATRIDIPSAAMLVSPETVENKGIYVTADAEVTVYGLNLMGNSMDAYLGLPTDVLGTEYLTMNYANYVPRIPGLPNIGIVATQDDTTVSVVPSADTSGNLSGVEFTINMSQGQTYYIEGSSFDSDLTGTLITSDKPVAVVSGAECMEVPDGFDYCDHIVEQMPPTSAWGREFVTLPLATRLNGDTFRFLASVDGTTININGSLVATLDRGEFHEQIVSEESVISASQPILVAQYSNSTTYDGVASDPFMMLIPPYEQFLAEYTLSTLDDSRFPINYINVVTPAAGVGAIELDGNPIPASEFMPIGTSGFSGAQLAVAVGSHTLVGTLPFGAFSYGYGDFLRSYGYPGGMSLSPVAIASSLALTTESAEALVSTETCLTALVADQDDQPLEGVRVDFVVSGINDISDFSNTDANGEALFCYSSLNAGEDSVEASAGQLMDTSTIQWVTPPSSLSLTPENVEVLVGNETCLTALVADQGDQPLEGVPVDFTVAGINDTSGSSDTDTNGEALFCYSSLNAGEDTVEASAGQLMDTSTIQWVTPPPPLPSPSSLSLTPENVEVLVGNETCLTALVADQGDQPLEGVPVDFTVAGINDTSGSSDTDTNGEALFCYSSLNAGEDTVEASVNQLMDTSTILWVTPAAPLPPPVTSSTVKASGGGAVGPWGLLVMIAGVIWLRRKEINQKLMKTLPVVLLSFPLLGVMPSESNANESSWYVGASIGQSYADYNASDLTGDMQAYGYSITDVSVNDTDTGLKLFGGYRVNQYFAVEAAYVDLGEVTSEMTTDAADMQQFVTDLSEATQFMTESIGLSAVGTYPVNERIHVFGKLGFHFWEANLNAFVVDGVPYDEIDKDGVDLTWGIGYQVSINEMWSARLEYERFKADDDWIGFISVGAVVAF